MVSLPSVVFALSFGVLGWIAGHAITYGLTGLMPHGHHGTHGGHHHGHHAADGIHGYMDALGFVGVVGVVLAFILALRMFFQWGTFGEWLREGGVAGTRRQMAMAAVLPAGVFVAVEHLERAVAGVGVPPVRLLVAGVIVELMLGLMCLALVRLTFRVAGSVIEHVARSRFARPARRASSFSLADTVFARPSRPMAESRAGRAPPARTISFRSF